MKPIPRRPSLLDPYRADIETWLEAQPAMTAVEVLARLKQRHPDMFTDNHLRTTQRTVKAWRALEAKKIIRSATAELVLTPGEWAARRWHAPWSPSVTSMGEATGRAGSECRWTPGGRAC